MKRAFAILLCAAMLLTLAGCGGDGRDYKGLYEKYSGIIDSLEEENYSAAMSQVAGLAQQAMEAEKGPRSEPQKLFCDGWYAYQTIVEDAPIEFAVKDDGTCTVNGQAMTWMVNRSSENGLEAIFNDGAENRYYVYFRRDENADNMSWCTVYTCKNDEYGISSDKYLADYMSDPLASKLIKSWRLLEGDAELVSNLHIYRGNFSGSTNNGRWSITSEKGGETLSALAVFENSDTQYTMTLAQRDGHYVLNVTDNATGAAGLYCCEEYGFEETWPERIYAVAMDRLGDYLRHDSFWMNEKSYSGNDALVWLYQSFSQVKDYKDSSDMLQRFTILPSLLTSVTKISTDQLGNESKSTVLSYTYDQTGKITVARGSDYVEFSGINGGSTPQQLTYDASGKIEKVSLGYINGNVEGIGTPVYDENGRMVSMAVQKSNASYTATFTYDDQGRITGLEIPKHAYTDSLVFTYTYDENGTLIQKVKNQNEGYYIYTTDYTYENGALKQQVVTTDYRYGDGYSTTYVFTNDDQGRPLSAEITTTDTRNTYASMRQEYTYEDLYFFDTEGLEVSDDGNVYYVDATVIN